MRALAHPGIPVPGVGLALVVRPMRALAVEIDGLPADFFALRALLRVVELVQVAPRDHLRIRIVDRYDPPRKARAAEIADRFSALEQRPVLREIGQQVIVDPDPDVVAAAACVGIEESEIPLVEVHDGQFAPDLLELHARHSRVQERRVEGIHRILAHLQPVAGRMNLPGHHLVAGQFHHVQAGKGRLALRRAEVRENQSLVLDDRIGAVADAFPQLALRRLPRRLENPAIDAVAPAVIRATDAVIGDDSEFERHPAMAAVLVHQPDVAREIAKEDQVLAQDTQRQRPRRETVRHHDRVPEPAQIFSARRTGIRRATIPRRPNAPSACNNRRRVRCRCVARHSLFRAAWPAESCDLRDSWRLEPRLRTGEKRRARRAAHEGTRKGVTFQARDR